MIQSNMQLACESSRPSEDEATWARWHASRVGCPFNEEVETEPSDSDPEWLTAERAEFNRLVAQLRADPDRQSLIEKARAASETPWVDPFDYTVSVLLRTNEVTEAEEEWLSEYAADLGADWYTDGRDHTYWWPTEADERKAVARMRTQPWYEGMQATAPEEPERWPGLVAPDAPTMPSGALSANEEPAPVSQPGSALPAVVEGFPEPVRDFWKRRPVFEHIEWAARVGLVSPWAVLGAVLAHVACRVGPHVVLPPLGKGQPGSLNFFVGLVGTSGDGKGEATGTAIELLGLGDRIPTKKLGTGQGIDASFTHPHPKEGPIQFNDVALFTVGEIDALAAHSQMNGSTLLVTLREVYSGEALGAHYSGKDKRRPVRAHAYRAALIAGIQPAKSDVLLDDADGGTPQRFLWCPTLDPDSVPLPGAELFQPPAPATDWPGWTDYEVWTPNGQNPDDEPVEVKPRIQVNLHPSVQREVRRQHAERRRARAAGATTDLDAHSMLTRLKVAALLGILDRRCEVSPEDWELAGLAMWVSNASRAECQKALAAKATDRQRARGRADAAREEARTEALEKTEEEKLQKVTARVMGKLQKEARRLTQRDITRFLGRDGKHAAQALERVVGTGLVKHDQEANTYSAVVK